MKIFYQIVSIILLTSTVSIFSADSMPVWGRELKPSEIPLTGRSKCEGEGILKNNLYDEKLEATHNAKDSILDPLDCCLHSCCMSPEARSAGKSHCHKKIASTGPAVGGCALLACAHGTAVSGPLAGISCAIGAATIGCCMIRSSAAHAARSTEAAFKNSKKYE